MEAYKKATRSVSGIAKGMSVRGFHHFITASILLLLPALSQAQGVPVALSPVARQQFFNVLTSLPLAGGKICTFNAGTTTPAATYSDVSGSFQNTNPIVLDSSGFAVIYLANQEYKFVVYDASGNNACPNTGVQQWAQDNVSAFQPVVGTQTIIFAGVTVDPIGQAGMMDYRTDIPCFRGFTNQWDCFVETNLVQTLTNKTLTAPTITSPSVTGGTFTTPTVNSVQVVNSPGTYLTVGNSVTGTVVSRLTKLVGGLAQFMATTDTGGSVGIAALCITSCGQPGSTTIQQSGSTTCFFDNATTAGDYVQISALTGGSCHDSGATLPTTGQIIGRVLVTSALSATPLSLDLFPPEIAGFAALTAVKEATMSSDHESGNGVTCGGANNACTAYIFPSAHTLVRVIVSTQTAPSGCGTNPSFGVRDVTSSTTLSSLTPTLANTLDSGAISVLMPAGDTIGVGLVVGGVGCTTYTNAVVAAVYQ